MEEKGISRKEKEKNEGEGTRGASNNSGTLTYMKLLYKGNVRGRYSQVYRLLIFWVCGLDDCIYCTVYIHTIHDYR